MKWRVGIYTRISRYSEYSESNSIDNQLSLIRHYCVTNNLDIVETYIDNVLLRYIKCPDCGSKSYKKKN